MHCIDEDKPLCLGEDELQSAARVARIGMKRYWLSISRLLHDKSGNWVARTLVWEMEAFSIAWRRPTVGIFDFEVNAPFRRQSVGRYFLSLIMKYIQDQFFTLVELQLEESNQYGLDFLRSLEFQHVDTGQVFVRNAEAAV